MKRNYSILFLISMVLMLFITACGGSSGGGGSTSSTQPETVTIWDGWASNYVAPKQAIFDAYMKLHPNITIKLVNVPQNIIQKSRTTRCDTSSACFTSL